MTDRVSLGSVASLVMGQAPAAADCNKEGRGTPFVKVGEFGIERPVIREWTTDPKKIARESDVLICVVGATCGKINLGADCAIGRSVAAIRPDRRKIEQRYLGYFMRSKVLEMRSRSQGAAQTVITREMISELEIPLPPLSQQQHIVAVLDGAFANISAAADIAERNAINAAALFSSQLRDLLDREGARWPRVNIGEAADARLGKMLDKLKNRGTPKPYLRNLNVRWFSFELADMLEMPFEDGELEKYSAMRGDLLIVEGGYPGRAAVWDSDEPVCFQKAVHRVRFDDPRLARILMYMLFAWNSDGTLRQHFSGTGIQHLTGQSLAKITMPIPPEPERDEVIDKIEAMLELSRAMEQVYKSKLSALAELKQSILSRAFSGELAGKAAAANDDSLATPEQAANILAFMHWRHERANRSRFFGHVMAQKSLDLVERVGGVELGRRPYKDAAGPNDKPHMTGAEVWARENQFFEFVERAGGGYDFKKLANYGTMLLTAKTALKPVEAELGRVANILVGKDKVQAEIFATVLAAWNNLIIDGKDATEAAILREARDDWHPDKIDLPIAKFQDAIREIRRLDLIPDGTAKAVRHKQAALF